MTARLNLEALLNFFDYAKQDYSRHAAAINAVMGEDLGTELLVKFLVEEESYSEVKVLARPVTTGQQKGPRLDRWIVCSTEANDRIIYQVEIKNWNAYSKGGKKVKESTDEPYLKEYRKERWHSLFDRHNLQFKAQSANKVLVRMLVPPEYRHYRLEPLICFWEAIHPDGDLNPFFSVKVKASDFQKLNVFSMSNYVRLIMSQANRSSIPFQMNDVTKRLEILNLLYGR